MLKIRVNMRGNGIETHRQTDRQTDEDTDWYAEETRERRTHVTQAFEEKVIVGLVLCKFGPRLLGYYFH